MRALTFSEIPTPQGCVIARRMCMMELHNDGTERSTTMEITTAARRAARLLNKVSSDYRVGFDADGREVESVVGPEAFPPRGRYVLSRQPGERATYAGVQEAMDAQDADRALMGFLPGR